MVQSFIAPIPGVEGIEMEHAKKPSATKSGPGRYHQDGCERGVKRVKEAGGYGKGLVAARTRQQKRALELKAKLS
jgi:hypothetical protein